MANSTIKLRRSAVPGKVPTIEAYYKDGSNYITIPIQPVFDAMPNPTSITVTIGGIPADTWYIKLS